MNLLGIILGRKESMKHESARLTTRKEITAPCYFSDVDLAWLNEEMGADFFPAGCNGIIVKPWLPELGGICVTIILDKVLEQAGTTSGSIICCTGEAGPVDRYVALGTLEMQSSGINYAGSFQHQGMDVMILCVDAGQAKKEIVVPDDAMDGFSWRISGNKGQEIPVHHLPAESFGGAVSLSFAVCGEFNLYMYFVKEGENTLPGLFSKGFCCK